MKTLIRIGLVSGLLGAVLPLPLVAAVASVSPSSELRAVIAAANAEDFVHVTSSARLNASLRVTITGTVGTSSGTQTIDYDLDGNAHLVTVVLLDQVAYIKGDATVLQKYMGLKATEARRVAGKWFKMLSTVPDYTAVSGGLTVSSVVNEFNMSGAITALADRKLDGSPVIALSGNSVASALTGPSLPETLYASTNGKPLPIEVTQTQSGRTATITFADWNTAVRVAAPSTTLVFASSWLS